MIFQENLIHISNWKKYKNKFLLNFRDNEIEANYQRNLYTKLFFFVSLIIFVANFINTFIYFSYSTSLSVIPNSNNTSSDYNSTSKYKQNITSNITYKVEVNVVDDLVTFLGLGFSGISMIIFLTIIVMKLDAFFYKENWLFFTQLFAKATLFFFECLVYSII